jgi:acyl carrier protein
VPPRRRFEFDDLKQILVHRLGTAEDQIPNDPSATLDQIGLDSLAFIELQTALEDDWGVRIRDEDVERIYTVGEALDYVNERLAEQEPAQRE